MVLRVMSKLSYLVVAFSLSSWGFLHDEDDEENGHGTEDGSSAQGPVPIAGKGRRETAADNIAEAAEKNVVQFRWFQESFT